MSFTAGFTSGGCRMSKPRINIVSEGMGHDARVYTEDGAEITSAIQEIDINLRVGEPNTARIKAILVGADIDAEIVELQTRVLPPPAQKPQYRLRIGPYQFNTGECRWQLDRLTPLPTYGVKEEQIDEGNAMNYDGPVLEFFTDAPEEIE